MPARRKSPRRSKSRSKSPRRVLKRRSSGKARTSVTRRSPKRRTYKGGADNRSMYRSTLKSVVEKVKRHECFSEWAALNDKEATFRVANTYIPSNLDALVQNRKIPNAMYIPAWCQFKNGTSAFHLMAESDELLNDSHVTPLESLAFSSAACASLHHIGSPHLAPLNRNARCRMADGAFWDRCAIATVVNARPEVQDILYIGTGDINVLLDYARPHGKISFDKYTGNVKHDTKISDSSMTPQFLFIEMNVYGDDTSGLITCTTNDQRTIRIHYRLYNVRTGLQMLFEMEKVKEWRKYGTELMSMPAPRTDKVCDALCIQGGGMIALMVGVCAMSKLDEIERLPKIISGVSGGAWATAVYFSHIKSKRHTGSDGKTLLRAYVDTMLKLSLKPFVCTASPLFLDALTRVLQTFRVNISNILAKFSFLWSEFTEGLVGTDVKWTDMHGYDVYHPCCVLNDRAILTPFEVSLLGIRDRRRTEVLNLFHSSTGETVVTPSAP